jgi:hypothetical protein
MKTHALARTLSHAVSRHLRVHCWPPFLQAPAIPPSALLDRSHAEVEPALDLVHSVDEFLDLRERIGRVSGLCVFVCVCVWGGIRGLCVHVGL